MRERGKKLYQKTVLNNGLRVVTRTMPKTQSVSICIFVAVGSRYETDSQAGISHFVEHMLFRGTERRPTSRDISEAVERVGGILNGGTDRESTMFWCKVACQHFTLALDVLSDMILNSKLSTDDIEKERQVIIEEINMSNDEPSSRVGNLVEELLYSGNSLGRDIIGSKKTVSAITRDDLAKYIAARYKPASTVVSIAGGLEHKDAVEAVERCFGAWRNVGRTSPPKPYIEKTAKRVAIERRDIEQTHLCLAFPGLSIFDPQRFTIDMMNVVLGCGMSCRLFSEVRDKLGLAYNVQSFSDHLWDTGSFIVYAGVDTAKAELALEAIIKQLQRFCWEPLSCEELTKAKEMSKGQMVLRLEDSRHMAGWLGGQEVRTGRILTVKEVSFLVDAVTIDDIQKLAEQLVDISRFRLSVVGPQKKVAPLKKLVGA